MILTLALYPAFEVSEEAHRPSPSRLTTAPRIRNKSIEAEDDCATRRAPRKTRSSRRALHASRAGAESIPREARAPQSLLRDAVRNGRLQGEPGSSETEGVKKDRTAASRRTESSTVGRKTGGDQRQVSSARITNGRVVEGGEAACTAASRHRLQGAPKGVREVKRNASRRVSEPPIFANREGLGRCLLCMATMLAQCRDRVAQYAAVSRGSAAL